MRMWPVSGHFVYALSSSTLTKAENGLPRCFEQQAKQPLRRTRRAPTSTRRLLYGRASRCPAKFSLREKWRAGRDIELTVPWRNATAITRVDRIAARSLAELDARSSGARKPRTRRRPRAQLGPHPRVPAVGLGETSNGREAQSDARATRAPGHPGRSNTAVG